MSNQAKKLKQLIVPFILLITPACSYQYIDSDGNHRVLGISNVLIPPSHNSDCKENGVTVTTVGISFTNLPSHGGLSLGYSSNTSISIPLVTDLDTSTELVEAKK